MRRKYWFALVSILVLVGAAGCGNNEEEPLADGEVIEETTEAEAEDESTPTVDDETDGATATSTPTMTSTPTEGTTSTTTDGSASMRTIEVIMTSFDLMSPTVTGDMEPMTITLEESGTYTFQAVNDSSIVHALEVEGQGIEAVTGDVPPGETAELTVTLEAGTYDLYCPIGNHKQQGMDGSVEVTAG